jgi:hypothetical protein
MLSKCLINRAKTRIGENVNLRESCEDDTAAIALTTKNTKSPHFRDALPVLIATAAEFRLVPCTI